MFSATARKIGHREGGSPQEKRLPRPEVFLHADNSFSLGVLQLSATLSDPISFSPLPDQESTPLWVPIIIFGHLSPPHRKAEVNGSNLHNL
jgi:hypothetical protein